MVLISLFELNTPEFTMLLGALPKTFQDGATKLLHSHLKTTGSGGGVVSGTSHLHPFLLLATQTAFLPFRGLRATPRAALRSATPPAGPVLSPRPLTVPMGHSPRGGCTTVTHITSSPSPPAPDYGCEALGEALGK